MTGVIWSIQLVHYALFGQVGAAGWRDYHAAHTRRMTWVVLPAMVVELGTAGLLALAPPLGVPRPLLLLGLALAALTWAVTFFVSVPLHAKLSKDGMARRARRWSAPTGGGRRSGLLTPW